MFTYKIRVKVKKVAWNQMAALPNCKKSRRFCQLTGRDYLTTSDLVIIEKLGFTIVTEEE